jgi:transposase InsO family protein
MTNVNAEVAKSVVEYKKKNSDHGFLRIEQWLKNKHLVVVPRKTIRAVLKEKGLLTPADSSFDRDEREKTTRRFEAATPREMYQMDITYIYLKDIPVLYLVCVIDDHSRFCVNASLCHDQRSETVIDVFHEACQRYGRPTKVLTDQGKVFYSWSMERTKFQDYCDAMKIEHIVCEAHHPQSQGKVERFHQTLKRELLGKVRFESYEAANRGIGDFIHRYNYDRPHQGIGGAYPADRFHGVSGVVSRCRETLVKGHRDLSQGYVVIKQGEHMISVLTTSEGIEVMLDGELMRPAERKPA